MSDPRVEPPGTDGERAALAAWLRYHRDTLAWKCAGLTAEQLGWPPEVSAGRPRGGGRARRPPR